MSRIPGLVLRALLLVAAVLLPAALPGSLPAPPDLVVLVVASVALMRGPLAGAFTGLAGGWLVDLVPPGGEPLGASALSYLCAGVLAGWARRYADWSPLLPLLAAVGAAIVVQGVRGVVAAAGVGVAHPSELAWSVGLTALVAVIVLPLLLGLERFLAERRWS